LPITPKALASKGEDANNTLMSWTLFAGMTDEDLGAIYAFLMQSGPRGNEVVVWD
jgi:hypothetical protein